MIRIEGEGNVVPIKAWVDGVELEFAARRQLINIASLPVIHREGIAVMPDVHHGIGATVGSVIPTVKAIIPAAVGVDIGCGMNWMRTSLTSHNLPSDLTPLYDAIRRAVPVGFSSEFPGHVKGSFESPHPATWLSWCNELAEDFRWLEDIYPKVTERGTAINQLGTLGGGNHFIEVCLDEEDHVSVLLHSGSRGIGNRIGTRFIELAREYALKLDRMLPDRDCAWLDEGTPLFADYVRAVEWAQRYAAINRIEMLNWVSRAIGSIVGPYQSIGELVSCHHNYAAREWHYDTDVWLTRKGAVSARAGQLGIIPGSMGAKSFIVRGRGNAESYQSCSHGAGRRMSRGEAKRRITVEQHRENQRGIMCRADETTIDEAKDAYKDIDAVMAAQVDLVDVVHTLKQILVVKG